MRFLITAAMAIMIIANPCIAATMPSIGNPPPVLSMQNLKNQTITLSDIKNKPIILAFFTSWSDSCSKEINALNGLYEEYKDKGLEVIAVSFDKKTKPLEEFVAANKVKFNVLSDKKLKSIEKFAILIIPTTFTIGKDGNISQIFVDYDDNVEKSLREFVKSELLVP